MKKEVMNGFQIRFRTLYRTGREWRVVSWKKQSVRFTAEEGKAGHKISLKLEWKEVVLGREYTLSFCSDVPAQVRLEMELLGEEELFHLIPANIFGDNNLQKAQPGEYPMLTYEHPEDVFCSPFWELRADRAAQPLSILCCRQGAVGISIPPYTDTECGFIRNGVRAELPGKIAVSVGYTNDPVTYVNKREHRPGTGQACTKGTVKGRVYAVRGQGRQAAHRIVEEEYYRTREVPVYQKSKEEAAQALLNQFADRNWSAAFQNYTNMECRLPGEAQLKPWRQLAEIGWTGGAVLGYPFQLAKEVLGLPDRYFAGRLGPEEIFDEIVRNYHEGSGFINDVTRPDWNPAWEASPVNGWWTGLKLAYDCHCAYTNGSAAYYLLKTVYSCKKRKKEWLDTALKVLDTVIGLQREDGNYGYTYAYDRKAVLDWDGFAGCWFAAAMAYAYKLTGEVRYLRSAEMAMEFYGKFVRDLNCYGTPMDTWKSVDEEGNFAFIRAARLLHEFTGERKYLDYLEEGACYQYLWQYGFRARPEYRPLRGSQWNSCGSSITSVSNPHAHPMGALIVNDIEYLAEKTGNSYHGKRAQDLFAWLLHTMELYPEVTGYGDYGVLTERYCPSDGLTIETYEGGEPASMWFTYNGWAAANVLEAVLEKIRKEQEGHSSS